MERGGGWATATFWRALTRSSARAARRQAHPFFADVAWSRVLSRAEPPPLVPPADALDAAAIAAASARRGEAKAKGSARGTGGGGAGQRGGGARGAAPGDQGAHPTVGTATGAKAKAKAKARANQGGGVPGPLPPVQSPLASPKASGEALPPEFSDALRELKFSFEGPTSHWLAMHSAALGGEEAAEEDAARGGGHGEAPQAGAATAPALPGSGRLDVPGAQPFELHGRRDPPPPPVRIGVPVEPSPGP